MTTTANTLATEYKKESRPTSGNLWVVALRRLFRQRSGIAGMIILGFLTLVAILAPAIAPYDPLQVLIGVEPVKKRDAPCIHLLGCPEDQPQHVMGIDGNASSRYLASSSWNSRCLRPFGNTKARTGRRPPVGWPTKSIIGSRHW